MSTLRVDNIKSRSGTAVSITASNSLDVSGNLNVTGSGNFNAPSGIATFATFSGNLTGNVTGNATGLSGTPDITVNQLTVNNDGTVGGALTVTGNMTVQGTQTVINTTELDVEDKTIGIGSTSAPSNTTADGGGIVVYGSTNGTNDKTIRWYNNSQAWTYNVGLDILGAVESCVAVTTSSIPAGPTKVVVECDWAQGTVFNHDLANGTVGIVSLKNFPVTKNSVSTFTLILTQTSVSAGSGAGNTVSTNGIGTNITLTPYGIAGFSTSARVSAGSTITLGLVNDDTDIVTLAVHYNGSGTGTAANYRTYGVRNGQYALGAVGI